MDTEGVDRPAHPAGDLHAVRDVFDTMPIQLVALEGAGHRFVAANRAYRTFVGRSDVIGRPVREILPEVEGQELFEVLDRVYATGRTERGRGWRIQLARRGRALTESFVDLTVTARRDPDGAIIGLYLSLTDVTERVRQARATQRTAADAQRRVEAARDVVVGLQRELLPPGLPVLPGLRLAGRYLVAAEDQAAGGDWFDALPRSDGTVALIAGDVVGHGIAASAAMGQLRAVLNHELALGGTDLTGVLERVDTFASRDPAMRATTVVLAVLDITSGRLRYSTCGHPEPLIVGDDGTTRFLAKTGNGPLGTGSRPVFRTETLAPGELVLLYSDGLIERPYRTLDQGRAELARVAADAAANRVLPVGAASTPADRVCQLTVELLTRTGYADDVTALAAHRPTTPLAPLVLTVPSVPSSVPTARHALSQWLDPLALAEDNQARMELAVSEVLANAVEHAYRSAPPGPVRVAARLLVDGVLELEVRDEGRWREPDPGETYRGRGLLLASRVIDDLRVTHPQRDGAAALGTTVTLRHRLHRPAVLASDAGAAPPGRSGRSFVARTEDGDGQATVRVGGPVDITTVDQLAHALALASRGGTLALTVDLRAVTHLASAGVRLLHDFRRQLTANQRELTLLATPRSPARIVLELVGLPHVAVDGQHGDGDGAQPDSVDGRRHANGDWTQPDSVDGQHADGDGAQPER